MADAAPVLNGCYFISNPRECCKTPATSLMKPFISRRQFLGTSAAAALGASALTAPGAPIKRAGGARLKISLNAYSFSKALTAPADGQPVMTLLQLLDFCAENNFDGIDPTGYFFPGYPKPPDAAYLNEFKRRAFQLGLDITGTGVRNNFVNPDAAARASDVLMVKGWIEVAARMGAPVIRVFAGPEPAGHAWDEAAEWLVADLKTCAAHGEKHGVLVGVQNHGDFLKSADQVLRIVRMVDSSWFGVIVDTGYFLTPDPYDDIARVLPHAVNFQIKESMVTGQGPVTTDLKRLFKVIRAAGYRGYLPIETLPVKGRDYDPLTRVPQFLREVREAAGA